MRDASAGPETVKVEVHAIETVRGRDGRGEIL